MEFDGRNRDYSLREKNEVSGVIQVLSKKPAGNPVEPNAVVIFAGRAAGLKSSRELSREFNLAPSQIEAHFREVLNYLQSNSPLPEEAAYSRKTLLTVLRDSYEFRQWARRLLDNHQAELRTLPRGALPFRKWDWKARIDLVLAAGTTCMAAGIILLLAPDSTLNRIMSGVLIGLQLLVLLNARLTHGHYRRIFPFLS